MGDLVREVEEEKKALLERLEREGRLPEICNAERERDREREILPKFWTCFWTFWPPYYIERLLRASRCRIQALIFRSRMVMKSGRVLHRAGNLKAVFNQQFPDIFYTSKTQKERSGFRYPFSGWIDR